MLSCSAEYALLAIARLAAAGPAPQSAKRLADATRVPLPYLGKIMVKLGRAGIVRAHRGPNGGYVLARPSDSVTILDVLRAADALPAIANCPLTSGCDGHGDWPVHRRLHEVLVAMESTFAAMTIAALVGGNSV